MPRSRKLEVAPGWFVHPFDLTEMLPSGHVMKVVPGIRDGRLIAESVTVEQPTPADVAYYARNHGEPPEGRLGGSVTPDVLRKVWLEWFYLRASMELRNKDGEY